MADEPGAMQVDSALIRELAELLDATNLSEIEVEDGARKIRVARTMSAATAPVALPSMTSTAVPNATPTADVTAPVHADPVKSPMVGTVFLAAEPGSKPFAAVGDMVSEGQTILIIEAMKVMNPIAAPRPGKVVQVMVENGQPVEYDQPLLVIE